MRHKNFSASLRFLNGIYAEASLMQKLEAVKGRLEVIIIPELGSSEFRQNVGVSTKCWSIYHQYLPELTQQQIMI